MKVHLLGGGRLAQIFAAAIQARGIEVTSGEGDLIFVAVDVESHDNLSELDAVMSALASRPAIAAGNVPVVVTSQVPPGWTRKWATSTPMTVYCHPHTIRTGHELQDALFPAVQPVGVADLGARLAPAYEAFLRAFQAPVGLMDYETAELSKIALNSILAATVEAANQAKRVADKVGAHWEIIESLLRHDQRIGVNGYVRPGTVGGHLPRDVETMRRLDR